MLKWMRVNHRVGPESYKGKVGDYVHASVVLQLGSRSEPGRWQWQIQWGFTNVRGELFDDPLLAVSACDAKFVELMETLK